MSVWSIKGLSDWSHPAERPRHDTRFIWLTIWCITTVYSRYQWTFGTSVGLSIATFNQARISIDSSLFVLFCCEIEVSRWGELYSVQEWRQDRNWTGLDINQEINLWWNFKLRNEKGWKLKSFTKLEGSQYRPATGDLCGERKRMGGGKSPLGSFQLCMRM